MTDLPAWEPLVRAGAFFGVLLVMLAWERRAPRRTDIPRRGRWFVNGPSRRTMAVSTSTSAPLTNQRPRRGISVRRGARRSQASMT
ncbi:MAG: hypothetical protein AAFV30_07010, partial [Pseudomonadota bacterium]